MKSELNVSTGDERAVLVSVVTPCHNAAPYVDETIAAVAAQTYPRVEHIVVDDASTDGSWEAIARHLPRITAVRLERQSGGSAARNRGVALARGAYLMFLDADDLIAPDTLAALVAAARRHPRTIAACDCKRWVERPDGSWGAMPRERPVPEGDTDLFEAFLTMSAWPPPCCLLWRRDAYELTGGWDEELARDQDTDILLRAYARGACLVRASGGTAFYRLAERTRASVSRGVSITRFRASVRVLDKLAAELTALGLFEAHAPLLSRAYHQRAMFGFRVGFRDEARQALRKGRALGRHLVSVRYGARLLERLVGLEYKERVAQWLGDRGILSASRRATAHRRRMSGLSDRTPVET